MAKVLNVQRPVKVVVVGDGLVGKTSLLDTYNTGKFPERYPSMTYQDETCTHTVDDVSYRLVLWDTCSLEKYQRLRALTYHGTDVFILCFALDDRASFEKVSSEWLSELHHHCPKTPIVLVGTKKDIRNLEVIKPQDGEELVERQHLSKYIECSAKTQEGLREVFDAAVRATLPPAPAPASCLSCHCVIV